MSAHQSIHPRATTGPAPLSAFQQQMWFLHQLNPSSPAYNTFRAFYLTGRLDLGVLKNCVKEIIRRHESLRTVVRIENGSPVQVVRQDMGFDFFYEDLRGMFDLTAPLLDTTHLSEMSELNERLVAEARRTIDPEHGPCLRVFVYRLREHEYCFQLVMHHISCDGWSLSVFFRELAVLYEALSKGNASPLKELPVQYSDYAVWQQEWLQSDAVKLSLQYWMDYLKGSPAGLELPHDFPRPAAQSFSGGLEEIIIPAVLTEKLKGFCMQEGGTLFMALLAVYQILLSRYTGRTDIVTGSPIANRSQPETHDMIGCFVNTLALRTDLSGRPGFREVLARVSKSTIDAYAHQGLPFQVLVEKLHSRRETTFTPLFHASFVLQNTPELALEFSGLSFRPVWVDNMTAKFDLTLILWEYAGELRGKLEYSTDLFKAETVRRMISHFTALLEGLLRDPDRPVSEVPLLTEEERHQILVEWGSSREHYPMGKCVHELFQEQAQQTPDADALVFGDTRLSFRELNIRANKLAHYLIGKGVGPEVMVGLCTERSPEMVIGILGILKAGGAYVPLDPAYPQERLAFILEDTGASLLVTQPHLRDIFPDRFGNSVCLDSELEVLAHCDTKDPAKRAKPENAAYVIYTSGSTGTPKGVLIEHYSVTRLFEGTRSLYHFNGNDVWTLFHSYAFDFSVWELWGALLCGGTLVIVPYSISRSIDEFYELLLRKRITVLNITPSVFRELVQADAYSSARERLSLRYIIFGGEELKAADLQSWYERHDDQHPQLVNMYGITETTVHATYYPLTNADALSSNGIRIGRPLPDLCIYLLDGNMKPVPTGVPGEIYVSGPGLARCYLNRPELTAERFPRCEIMETSGKRLYKSGDLGRYQPDGNIIFLGRKDNQLKVRGYRIEPGEIESHILSHADVSSALVQARDERGGYKSLVAYIVVKDVSKDIPTELKDMLKRRLPDYMVPSVFVPMKAFQLTPNGKVDLNALPDPYSGHADKRQDAVRPLSPFEEKLLAVWKAIFEREDIGIDDDFFELGGHSLLAMRLIAWVHRDLHVELSIHNVFESPTVADMARIAEQNAQ